MAAGRGRGHALLGVKVAKGAVLRSDRNFAMAARTFCGEIAIPQGMRVRQLRLPSIPPLAPARRGGTGGIPAGPYGDKFLFALGGTAFCGFDIPQYLHFCCAIRPRHSNPCPRQLIAINAGHRLW